MTYARNLNKDYLQSEEGKSMNRQEYGIHLYNRVVSLHKRGLITKTEFNDYRNQIEEQLFFDYIHKKERKSK